MNTSLDTRPRHRADPTLAAHDAAPTPEIGNEGRGPHSAGRGKEKLHGGRGRRGASSLSAAGAGYVGDWGGELLVELKEPVRERSAQLPSLETPEASLPAKDAA